MESLRGELLIAGPGLTDPNFWRTVVLVVEHSDEGAFGLVLNRPSETEALEAAPALADLIGSGELVFVGGPVAPSALVVLADFEDPGDAALIAFDRVGVLGESDEAEGSTPPTGIRRARAFAGHSGWGPGQLEAEIERGDWITEPATEADAFSDQASGLWALVLARKGGPYRLLARMPADPSLN